MAKDRTDKSIRNIKYALIGQVLNVIFNFVGRLVFVHILGDVFLGANGVFTNIISILSLAELGIGPALIYALYEPLVNNDKEKIKHVMHLYKVSYISIGVIITVFGTICMPFLPFFVKEQLPNTNLYLAFMLFVLTSGVSYFYSYKSSLLIADQRRYIVVLYQYAFYLLISLLQIVVLVITKNYILYLVVKLILTFLEHYLVARKTDKEYPYLKEKLQGELNKNTKDGIVKNVKAMIFHKIGGVVVVGTDNLIISRMVGVVVVGVYSNYTLIINTLTAFIDQIFSSIIASVGNLNVTESAEHSMEIYYKVFFLGFWIFAFCSISLMCLFNPFIFMLFGERFIFPPEIVFIIVLNFYLTGMRSATLTYKSAYGLYWQNRYSPLFEGLVNLVVSIVLCKYIGVLGVFIGTAVSTLTTCFWINPYTLFKYGFNAPMNTYWKRYGIYTLVAAVTGFCCYFACSFLPYDFLGFLAKGFICLILPNIIFVIVFSKTDEYQALKEIVMRKLLRRNIR